MVSVPSGSLWLGSPEAEGAADEHPQTKVEIAGFCLDAREVTVADYRACEKNKACAPLPTEVRLLTAIPQSEQAALSAECSARVADNQDLPATCVSWDDAARYCAWKGARLPTEAEWEWAATGGDDQLGWPWGSTPPDDAVVCWQRRSPCHVGGKRAEAFDLHDLAGNVSEWTSSVYGPYGAGASGDKMVVRGGNWESTKEDELRPKHRGSRPKPYRDITLGFRCAKSR
jgi:formylglycine-generating enzyme required for sulfatase activity